MGKIAKILNADVLFAIGFITAVTHLASAANDVERYAENVQAFRQNKSPKNFLRMALAEGVLVKDLGWLL